jgi:hypothetical protein
VTDFRTATILEPSDDMAGVQSPSTLANHAENAEGQLRTPVLVALDTVDSSNEMSLSLSRG